MRASARRAGSYNRKNGKASTNSAIRMRPEIIHLRVDASSADRSGFGVLSVISYAAFPSWRLIEGLTCSRRGSLGDGPGVDRDDAVFVHRRREAVHAPGRRSGAVLAGPVEIRSVAGALELARAFAPRHPASQVGALLPDGDDLVIDPGEVGLGGPDIESGGGGDIALGGRLHHPPQAR